MSALGIIPARAHSSRFPNKIIADILGKPMIQYVWEAASLSKRLCRLLVATDSEEIKQRVEAFGGEAVLTQGEFVSGTDRVASVALEAPEELIVNLQGDEPLLSAHSVDHLVEELEGDLYFDMATLAVRSLSAEALNDTNVVKVLLARNSEALYFSRQPLKMNSEGAFLKHIGIYAFRKEALMQFVRLAPSSLEKTERLEQLRALENGLRIKVVLQEKDSIAVDTSRDIQRVERYLLNRQSGKDQHPKDMTI